MNISKEDLLRINMGFGGDIRSDSSIDFAIERINDPRLGFYTKLAYLWRAILVDHPFSDGNKRTAVFLAYGLAEENKKQVIDREMLINHAISIAKKNTTSIRQIAWRLQNAIR